MSAIKISSNFEKLLYGQYNQEPKDLYNGEIRQKCDEDCEDNCNIDHGFYEIVEFTNLFDTK